MRCNQCASDNPTSNRFCGQCGTSLTNQGSINRGPDEVQKSSSRNTAVLDPFREDLERQRSELKNLRNAVTRPMPTRQSSPPVSSFATAPPNFGPENSAVNRHVDFGPAVPPTVGPTPLGVPNDWPASKAQARFAEGSISGPSFLGLSEPAPETNPNLAYLYEEDDSGTDHRRFWIAGIIAIAFAGFIIYMWRQNPNWHGSIAGTAQQIRQPGAGRPARPVPDPRASSTALPEREQLPQGNSAEARSSASSTPPEVQGRPTPAPQDGHTAMAANAEAPPSAGRPETPLPSSSSQPRTNQQIAGAESRTRSRLAEPDKGLVTKADAYLYGRGVPKNCDQAIQYLHTAADHGNSSARSKLGGLYATGNCVPLDRARAYNWFTLAHRAGERNVWLEHSLTMLWSQMTSEEKGRTLQAGRNLAK